MRAFGRREEPARGPVLALGCPCPGAGRERGLLAKEARGAREGHRPGRGSHTFPLGPPRLERAAEGRGKGGRGACGRAEGAGEGHLQPRSARARAPRAARSPPGAASGLSGGKVSEGRPRAAAETPAHSHWWAGAPASDPPRPPGSPPETEGAGGAGGPRARREGVGALRAVSWDRSGQRAAGRAPAPFPRFPRVCVGSAAASGSQRLANAPQPAPPVQRVDPTRLGSVRPGGHRLPDSCQPRSRLGLWPHCGRVGRQASGSGWRSRLGGQVRPPPRTALGAGAVATYRPGPRAGWRGRRLNPNSECPDGTGSHPSGCTRRLLETPGESLEVGWYGGGEFRKKEPEVFGQKPAERRWKRPGSESDSLKPASKVTGSKAAKKGASRSAAQKSKFPASVVPGVVL